MIDVVDLAGPSQRIEAAAEALRAGQVVVSPNDERSRLLADKVDRALFGFDVVHLLPHHDSAHAAGVLDVDSIADPIRLLQNPHLNRFVLQVDCSADHWREWTRAMLQRVSNSKLSDSIRLWLVWPQDVPRPTARSIHTLEWNGCLTSADVRIYAADRFRSRQGPGPTNFWEVLAAELAGPDLDLIERMSALRKPIYDIVAWLLSSEAGAAAPSVPFEGGTFESSIALARRYSEDACARNLLNHRIWSAQVRTIFVGLESERIGLLNPYKQMLEHSYRTRPPQQDEVIEEIPRDVEWGPAHFRLHRNPRVSATIISLLDNARLARNCLAHAEPIEPVLLRNLLDSAASAMRGRW